MMILPTIERLLNTFHTDKIFFDNGYYRIKKINPHTIKMAYLISGSCGETIPCPEITLSIEQNTVLPIHLINLATTPIINCSSSSSTNDFLTAELTTLLKKFEHMEQVLTK